MQVRVQTILFQQYRRRTIFNQLAAINCHDFVDRFERRQTMRDDNDRSTSRNLLEIFLNDIFRLIVKR